MKKHVWERKKVGEIYAAGEAKKSPFIRFLDAIIYWVIIVVTILGNFVLSLIMVPVLVVFTSGSLVAATAVLALAFGILMHVIAIEVEHLQKTHFVIFEILIPVLALINIYIITRLSNRLTELMEIQVSHSPVLVSVVYVIAFTAPHLVARLRKK